MPTRCKFGENRLHDARLRRKGFIENELQKTSFENFPLSTAGMVIKPTQTVVLPSERLVGRKSAWSRIVHSPTRAIQTPGVSKTPGVWIGQISANLFSVSGSINATSAVRPNPTQSPEPMQWSVSFLDPPEPVAVRRKIWPPQIVGVA